MRKILIFLFLINAAWSSEKTVTQPEKIVVGKLDWFTGYQAAVAAAKREQKPLLVAFTAPWCGWCKKMKDLTFTDERVQKELTEFTRVFVNIDLDKQTSLKFRVRSIPRAIILNERGQVMGDWLGFNDPEAMLELFKGLQEAQPAEAAPVPQVAQVARPKIDVSSLNSVGDPNGRRTLLDWMGNANPEVRQQVREELLGQGRAVLPLLNTALADPYLGTRVTAWEILQKLDPAAGAKYDPWTSPQKNLTEGNEGNQEKKIFTEDR